MSDLLPCPFCGGEAILMTPAGSRPYIMCAERFCGGPQNSTEVAIAAWNRRAIPATGVAVKPEELARLFHETYEALATEHGYETRVDTRQFDPSSPNGRLMIAVCARIRSALTVTTHDHAKVQALVEAGLLLDAYKAVLVLHRVMDKHGLTAGASAAKNIADRIVAAHPEFPGISALRGNALATWKGGK